MTTEEFLTHGLANPDDVDVLVKKLKDSSKKDHRYDLAFSLAAGKGGENLVESLLTGGHTVEVKRDFRTGDTGKVLVEYAAPYSSKPSGIITSEAEWYAFVLSGKKYNDEVVVFIKRDRLLKVLDRFGEASHPSSGLHGNSHFLLFKKEHLLSTDL